jgi:predicted nucleotidyltransferase component of viral defense system
MRLHKDKDIFKELVIATANDLGLQNFQVEKDYLVSLFLHELAKQESDLTIVFKGGTSLSKCYGMIDRFSEDIDLAVRFSGFKVTSRERKRLKTMISDVINALGMTLLNEDEVRSEEITMHTISGMAACLMEMGQWCLTSLSRPLSLIVLTLVSAGTSPTM